MKNNLNDLNDYLFEELERLNDDESLSSDVDFDKEIKRSKAITDVASKIIDNASTLLKAVELQEEFLKVNTQSVELLQDHLMVNIRLQELQTDTIFLLNRLKTQCLIS